VATSYLMHLKEAKGMAYTLKRHDESVFRDLQYLFREANNVNIPISFFEKKYDTSFTGKKFIGYIAYDEKNRPAASYTVLPCFVRFGDARILAAQIVDVITHPAHRMKGLFVMTAQKTHELAKSEGIKYLVGFPNKNSYPGFVKHLGCIHTEDMQQYTIKTRALPLLKAAHKYGWLRVFYNAYFQLMLKIFEKDQIVPNSVLDDGFAGIEHDSAFFSYKAFGKNHVLKAGRFSAWVKLEDGFIVGDIGRFNEDKFGDFSKAMRKLCFLFGVHQYTISSSPGAFIDRVFGKSQTAARGIAVIFLDLDMPENLNPGVIKYVMGDSDMF
jgi:hypothetical protein